jgi:hypothetical protein
MERSNPVGVHYLFVIISSQRWKFSQYELPHDGTGVISEWFKKLDDEVVAEFDARFAQFGADDKWIDLYRRADELKEYGERFEEMTKRREIPVTANGVLYRRDTFQRLGICDADRIRRRSAERQGARIHRAAFPGTTRRPSTESSSQAGL